VCTAIAILLLIGLLGLALVGLVIIDRELARADESDRR
jgi:hypothetical protein